MNITKVRAEKEIPAAMVPHELDHIVIRLGEKPHAKLMFVPDGQRSMANFHVGHMDLTQEQVDKILTELAIEGYTVNQMTSLRKETVIV